MENNDDDTLDLLPTVESIEDQMRTLAIAGEATVSLSDTESPSIATIKTARNETLLNGCHSDDDEDYGEPLPLADADEEDYRSLQNAAPLGHGHGHHGGRHHNYYGASVSKTDSKGPRNIAAIQERVRKISEAASTMSPAEKTAEIESWFSASYVSSSSSTGEAPSLRNHRLGHHKPGHEDGDDRTEVERFFDGDDSDLDGKEDLGGPSDLPDTAKQDGWWSRLTSWAVSFSFEPITSPTFDYLPEGLRSEQGDLDPQAAPGRSDTMRIEVKGKAKRHIGGMLSRPRGYPNALIYSGATGMSQRAFFEDNYGTLEPASTHLSFKHPISGDVKVWVKADNTSHKGRNLMEVSVWGVRIGRGEGLTLLFRFNDSGILHQVVVIPDAETTESTMGKATTDMANLILSGEWTLSDRMGEQHGLDNKESFAGMDILGRTYCHLLAAFPTLQVPVITLDALNQKSPVVPRKAVGKKHLAICRAYGKEMLQLPLEGQSKLAVHLQHCLGKQKTDAERVRVLQALGCVLTAFHMFYTSDTAPLSLANVQKILSAPAKLRADPVALYQGYRA